MITIEILTEDGDNINAAFYYEVPVHDRLKSARDNAREPAGTSLPPQQKAWLKTGIVHEYLVDIRVTNMEQDARRRKLEGVWENTQAIALADYASRYSAIGTYFDGEWH